nr:MAG TPA: hypothetical protein [Caudoviricetes sp.]
MEAIVYITKSKYLYLHIKYLAIRHFFLYNVL